MNSRPGKKAVGKRVSGFAWMAVAATFVVGTACSDSTGPVEQVVRIEPAAPTISLQATPQGTTLNTSVTLTNASSRSLRWSACGVGLEKAGLPALPPGKRAWEPVWARICYLLAVNPAALSTTTAGDPIYLGAVLKPGESVTIPIVAIVGQSPYPNFTGEAGLYRFRLTLSTEFMGTYYPLPDESSVSESFTLLPAS